MRRERMLLEYARREKRLTSEFVVKLRKEGKVGPKPAHTPSFFDIAHIPKSTKKASIDYDIENMLHPRNRPY